MSRPIAGERSSSDLTKRLNINNSVLMTACAQGVIKMGNKMDMYLCKKAMLKPVSHRTLGFPSTE